MNTAIQTIIDDFAFLDDWEDRYRYIIELGRALPPFPEEARTETNKVRGCASQVWLVSSVSASPEGAVLHFDGDSDAHIVRGLIAIALALFSDQPARAIMAADAEALFARLGLAEHLSQQRSNGLRSMVQRIKSDAAAALQ